MNVGSRQVSWDSRAVPLLSPLVANAAMREPEPFVPVPVPMPASVPINQRAQRHEARWIS